MTDEKPVVCPKCEERFESGRALGGHAKTHNRPPAVIDWELMAPTPECFEDEADWRYCVEQTRSIHPTVRRFTREYALAEACLSCTREYQESQIKVGRCHPPEGAMTPLRILEEGILINDD